MHENNITDAQYETISQGPDHVKFTMSSWIMSHNLLLIYDLLQIMIQ